ncbi:MAG: methylmalonyl Co-A mutase-associated GTPase MeaB [Betaproteobacteria bacterium]|nr:methylmalonyl Co-A mutase-associated GTPase MeaB [Betaproteobacteria bacterium]
MSAGLVERFGKGERRAVARAISAVENETAEAGSIIKEIGALLGRARVLGITGPPGAGKSTLTGALIGEYLRRGERVAVVAVDPSSPFSGGAILGDRLRMGAHQADPRVFIRSVASRGHLGGLSRTAARVIDVFDAAGYGVVMVETVGAGQAEVEIGLLADTRLLVCPPGLGDEVQAMKSGVFEIADIYVVNKADLPGADGLERELLSMIGLRAHGPWTPRVVRTVATSGEGVASLVAAIAAREAAGSARAGRRERMRRLLASGAADWLRERIESFRSSELERLCDAFGEGDLAPIEAWRRAAALVSGTKIED